MSAELTAARCGNTRAGTHVEAGNIAKGRVQPVLLPHLRRKLLHGSFGAVSNVPLHLWETEHLTAAQGPVYCAHAAYILDEV